MQRCCLHLIYSLFATDSVCKNLLDLKESLQLTFLFKLYWWEELCLSFLTKNINPFLFFLECKRINSFEAVLNEAFKLQCPVARSHLGASQLIWGTVEDVPIPITRCPSHCTTSGTKKPLCERTKTMEDGSLTISPMLSTDSQWFWCALTGNSTSCFTFRLYVKGVFLKALF